jgi:hypothetical protein
VWRSICNSKFILGVGSRWWIGSGTDIPLLNENWLFDASALNVQDTKVSLAVNLSVADVIMPDEKSWNLPLISSLFEPNSVLKIVKTPLYNSVTADKRICHREKDGMYSVKSAYHLCVQEELDPIHLKMTGNWNLIWKLKIPPRVKNLLWRICRQCIPTVCALCNEHDEDSRHIFFDCSSSKNIGSMCNFNNIITAGLKHYAGATELIFALLQQLNIDEAALMACIFWSIWKQRNNQVWNDITDVHSVVFSRAITTLNDWHAVQIMKDGRSLLPDALNVTSMPRFLLILIELV